MICGRDWDEMSTGGANQRTGPGHGRDAGSGRVAVFNLQCFSLFFNKPILLMHDMFTRLWVFEWIIMIEDIGSVLENSTFGVIKNSSGHRNWTRGH